MRFPANISKYMFSMPKCLLGFQHWARNRPPKQACVFRIMVWNGPLKTACDFATTAWKRGLEKANHFRKTSRERKNGRSYEKLCFLFWGGSQNEKKKVIKVITRLYNYYNEVINWVIILITQL